MEGKDTCILSLDSAALMPFAVGQIEPVAILNDQSSAYGRLVFCQVAADSLFRLADFAGSHEVEDVRALADMFTNQLKPLVAMLERITNDARPVKVGAP